MKAWIKETRKEIDVLPCFGDWGKLEYYQDANEENLFYYPEDIEIKEYYGN